MEKLPCVAEYMPLYFNYTHAFVEQIELVCDRHWVRPDYSPMQDRALSLITKTNG